MKILGLESKVAPDTKAIAHLASLVKDHRSNCLRVKAEIGELQNRLNEVEGIACEVVASAVQRQEDVSYVTGEGGALAAMCMELSLEVQCMLSLTEKQKSLRAGVAELVESSKKNVPKVRAKRRTADIEVAAEQERTERAEHTTRIAQLDDDVYELEGS